MMMMTSSSHDDIDGGGGDGGDEQNELEKEISEHGSGEMSNINCTIAFGRN